MLASSHSPVTAKHIEEHMTQISYGDLVALEISLNFQWQQI